MRGGVAQWREKSSVDILQDFSALPIRKGPLQTRRHRSRMASSPDVNNLRTARNAAIRTLSPAEDHRSSKTYDVVSQTGSLRTDGLPTLRYARRCFLAPIIQGNNFVLSPTATSRRAPASSSLETLDGVDGKDLIR